MRLSNKILFAINFVVISILAITFYIVNSRVERQARLTITKDLNNAFSIVQEFRKFRSELISTACAVFAESPRLKAAVDVQDPKTILLLSRELRKSMGSDLFLVTNARGKILAQSPNIIDRPEDIAKKYTIQQALKFKSSSDVWKIQDYVFNVVSAPIRLGADLMGSLTVGFKIDTVQVNLLKQMSGIEVAILGNRVLLISTEAGSNRPPLARAIQELDRLKIQMDRPFEITMGNERMLAMLFSPQEDKSEYLVEYLVFQSIDYHLQQALTPIRRLMIAVVIVSVIVTLIISYVISRSVAKPVQSLVELTDAVADGNYNVSISPGSHDELGYLAEKFEEMRLALKEKMEQLADLNINLQSRNVQLESALKKLEETQVELVKTERLAVTGKLTAQLSHELNNPIHNIQSGLDALLKRMPANIKGRELLEVAFDEATRMSKLTRQMLEIYRNPPKEEFVLTQLNNVIEDTLKLTEENLRRNRVELHTDLSQNLPRVSAIEDKLKQVFLNMISNAIDAMPGGGSLTVKTNTQNEFAVVDFCDTGIGIPSENMSKIFDAFFTTKSKVSGIGLGLSVSYGIIRQHGGLIEVQSAVKKGSQFSIKLPIVDPAKKKVEAPVTPIPKPEEV